MPLDEAGRYLAQLGMGWLISAGIHVATVGPIPESGSVDIVTTVYRDGRPLRLDPEPLPADRLATWRGYSLDMHGLLAPDQENPRGPTWHVREDDGTTRYVVELDRIRVQFDGSGLYAELIAIIGDERPIRTGIFGWDHHMPPRIPPQAEIEKAVHGLELLGLVRELEAARGQGKKPGDGAYFHTDAAFLAELDKAISHVQWATGRANPDARLVMRQLNCGKTTFYNNVKKATGKRWRDVAAKYELRGIQRN